MEGKMNTVTSRRTMLAGVAAAIPAAIALPALADAPAETALSDLERNFTADNMRKAFESLDPQTRSAYVALVREYIEAENIKKDAKLFQLWDQLKEAEAATDAYRDGPYKEAEDRCEELTKGLQEPKYPDMPAKFRKLLPDPLIMAHLDAIKKLNPNHPYFKWHKTAVEREWSPKYDAYRRKRHRLVEQSGVEKAEKKWGRMVDRYYKIGDKIMRTPAHSLAGIRIKFETAKLLDLDNKFNMGELDLAWPSVRDDILNLTIVGAA
jgi:hypothetical protein